jgi:hypothetical protein
MRPHTFSNRLSLPEGVIVLLLCQPDNGLLVGRPTVQITVPLATTADPVELFAGAGWKPSRRDLDRIETALAAGRPAMFHCSSLFAAARVYGGLLERAGIPADLAYFTPRNAGGGQGA